MRFLGFLVTWPLRALRTRLQRPAAPTRNIHTIPPAHPRRRHANTYDDAA